jgi:hypothetical protein
LRCATENTRTSVVADRVYEHRQRGSSTRTSFALYDDYAEAVDFNHEKYRIDLATGDCVIVQ